MLGPGPLPSGRKGGPRHLAGSAQPPRPPSRDLFLGGTWLAWEFPPSQLSTLLRASSPRSLAFILGHPSPFVHLQAQQPAHSRLRAGMLLFLVVSVLKSAWPGDPATAALAQISASPFRSCVTSCQGFSFLIRKYETHSPGGREERVYIARSQAHSEDSANGGCFPSPSPCLLPIVNFPWTWVQVLFSSVVS